MKKSITILTMALILAAGVPGASVYANEIPQDVDYDSLVKILESELRAGNLDSEDEIRQALEQAESEYDVELSEGEEKKVVDIMNTVNSLGLDGDEMADLVDDVYDNLQDKLDAGCDDVLDNIEEQIVDSAAEAVKKSVKKSISDYFDDFFGTIREFIDGVLDKITV